MKEIKIEFQSRKLVYQKYGSRTPLLLIHGYCSEPFVWHKIVDELAKDHLVLIPYLPGYGKSELPENLSIDGMALACKAILDNEECKKAIVIGHSMGGYIAMSLAELFPQLLLGLCLFHSTSINDTEEKIKARKKGMDFMKKHGTKALLGPFYKQLFGKAFIDENQDQFKTWKQRGETYSPKTLIDCNEAMMKRPNRNIVLEKLDIPISFIIGEEDSFVPMAINLEEALLANKCHIGFMPNIGHAGMLEKPKLSFQLLKEFFSLIKS